MSKKKPLVYALEGKVGIWIFCEKLKTYKEQPDFQTGKEILFLTENARKKKNNKKQ